MGGRPVTNVSTPILPDAKNCVDTGRSWPPQQCISHAEKWKGKKGAAFGGIRDGGQEQMYPRQFCQTPKTAWIRAVTGHQQQCSSYADKRNQ